MAQTEPKLSAPDYMLQGGSDASNTDPFANQPPAGQQWGELSSTRYVHSGARPETRSRDLFDRSALGRTLDYVSGNPIRAPDGASKIRRGSGLKRQRAIHLILIAGSSGDW
jgi:hypothetical protein